MYWRKSLECVEWRGRTVRRKRLAVDVNVFSDLLRRDLLLLLVCNNLLGWNVAKIRVTKRDGCSTQFHQDFVWIVFDTYCGNCVWLISLKYAIWHKRGYLQYAVKFSSNVGKTEQQVSCLAFTISYNNKAVPNSTSELNLKLCPTFMLCTLRHMPVSSA